MTRCMLLAAAALLAAGVARGTPADRVLLYGGAGQGTVIFDGRTHAASGLSCNDCHLELFVTRKRALITRADHEQGSACFACHDGRRAFSDCGGCHRKP
jgi:phosphate transport system substrate-binding protein